MILIIDDDIAVQASLSLLLKQSGFNVNYASNPEEGSVLLKKLKPEAIILDMNFGNDTSGRDGIDFLKKLKEDFPDVPVILLTAWASISLAVEGMKNGASDFVSKPWENTALINALKTAINLKKDMAEPAKANRKELDKKYNFSNIIGESGQLISLLETIGRVSKTDAPVLILGESGTGKELIAEAIHNNSNRYQASFVKVNLGGISTSLFESEMFGHKKGAFTDAYAERKGFFEIADKGSIFLDEIGDLDFNSQVKLLRVLQDKTYQVLGDSTSRKTDVRVICATNRNLSEMVKKGTFREDLFYRINLITANMPPLRERKEDIPILLSFFLKKIHENYQSGQISVSDKAMKWLQNCPYTGNIRELKNLAERTWLLTGKTQLDIQDFEKAMEQSGNSAASGSFPEPGSMTMEEIEKEMIIKAIEKYRNNISHAAKSLGISRGTFYRRLEKFNIPFDKE